MSLNGGTLFERSLSSNKDPKARTAPKIIRLKLRNGTDIVEDDICAISVSSDAVVSAIFLESTQEILVYRFLDSKGNLLTEKAMQKPIVTLSEIAGLGTLHEIYIFKGNKT